MEKIADIKFHSSFIEFPNETLLKLLYSSPKKKDLMEHIWPTELAYWYELKDLPLCY